MAPHKRRYSSSVCSDTDSDHKDDKSSNTSRKNDFILRLTEHRYSDPSFSDFKVICAGKECNVHRAILASHFGYFKRLFASVMKKAAEQKVELNEDPEGTVAALIEYLYSFDYNAFNIRRSYKKKEKPTLFDVQSSVFTIADRYDIAGLKDLAFSNFVKLTDSYIVAREWRAA